MPVAPGSPEETSQTKEFSNVTTSTLKEARIVMPLPEGGRPRHLEMRRQLVEAFGGYTACRGKGGWLDPVTNEVVNDNVIVYDVAIKPGQNVKLYLIAKQTAEALNQEAVYIRYPDGVVEIVPISQEEALNAPRLVQIGDVWETRGGACVQVKHKITSADAFVVRPWYSEVSSGNPDEYLVTTSGAYMAGMGPHPRDLVRFVYHRRPRV